MSRRIFVFFTNYKWGGTSRRLGKLQDLLSRVAFSFFSRITNGEAHHGGWANCRIYYLASHFRFFHELQMGRHITAAGQEV